MSPDICVLTSSARRRSNNHSAPTSNNHTLTITTLELVEFIATYFKILFFTTNNTNKKECHKNVRGRCQRSSWCFIQHTATRPLLSPFKMLGSDRISKGIGCPVVITILSHELAMNRPPVLEVHCSFYWPCCGMEILL